MEARYRQCRLERGNTHHVAWIPSKLAIEGKTVGFKENGEWSEGWTVASASGVELSHSVLLEREGDYKRHRKATDV